MTSLKEPDVLLAGSATTRGDEAGIEGTDDGAGVAMGPLACTFETLSNDGGERVLSGDSSGGAVTGSKITGGMSVFTCAGAGTFVGPEEA